MIEAEMIPAKIQMEIALTEDGALQVIVLGETANWVMKRFEKSAGFSQGVSSLDANSKRRRVLFTEKRAGGDEWQPFAGDAAQLPDEALLWQDETGDFHFGAARRDAADGSDYLQTTAGEKLPLAQMVAWRAKPLAYRLPQQPSAADDDARS